MTTSEQLVDPGAELVLPGYVRAAGRIGYNDAALVIAEVIDRITRDFDFFWPAATSS